MTQAVVFLARGIGGGLDAVRAFLKSYEQHCAGLEHDLIILAKGWEQASDREELGCLAIDAGAIIIDLPDDGFDLGAYMRAARGLQHEWICFLNTHSRIQANGWLKSLRSAAAQPKAGVVGATGSWGTMYPIPAFMVQVSRETLRHLPPKQRIAGHIVSYAYWSCRRLLSLNRFPGFPNPHLRSNAFLINRELFVQFSDLRCIPKTKRDAYFLESGRGSITQFILQRGLLPIVVGANGQFYRPDDWCESATCTFPGQHNLLVSDNHTRGYQKLDWHERRIWEIMAWGKAITPLLSENSR